MASPEQNPPVYTAAHPPRPDVEHLRATIPGWGADLDPSDRPSVPKLRRDLNAGAHWEFPDRQAETVPRERSIEHRVLTPAFGTAQPLRGASGTLRRFAYRYSEGRAAHWLILLFADRVDVAEHRVIALLRGRPDNPVSEMGLRAEVTRNGLSSRIGRGRTDVQHTWIDTFVVSAPWLVLAAAVTRVVRSRRRV
ncbi:hypothetical protein KUF57_07910 [Mycolicibacterium sp. PAM1]|uniref:Uncharacterized protein n=1 Tax=Mycolicibacterium gilvum (strain PYR-GCK) TaxID=350054 RepID=A4TAY6_MYCGI|nr:hypothetical protein [Mycolicibacterium sp. PAM1]ABP45626.1 hypothetical protein Mflv_3149 [Mycolicibacterium gilvum PYR-GCK]MBV5243458.1 hypothetical protein [Mycolicibacterium sp. PAM1]